MLAKRIFSDLESLRSASPAEKCAAATAAITTNTQSTSSNSHLPKKSSSNVQAEDEGIPDSYDSPSNKFPPTTASTHLDILARYKKLKNKTKNIPNSNIVEDTNGLSDEAITQQRIHNDSSNVDVDSSNVTMKTACSKGTIMTAQ